MLKKLLYFALLLPAVVYADCGVIPQAIRAPAGHKPFLAVHAKGDQIYQCTLNGGSYSWQLNAPDARLFDDKGQVVGKHYAGPIWEYKEGSNVVGKVISKIDSPKNNAISWLLVEVVGHKGNGVFSRVSFINRINTHGGLTPESACDGNHLGGEKRVPYTADYVFYTREIQK